jgi:FkbM family methyltransferase
VLNTVEASPSSAIAGWLRASKRAVRSICPTALLNWREARFYARYGEVELHLLDLLCRRDRDAIDVGANDGSYVHFLRRYSRFVHAFEPLPDLADALRSKFAHGNVVVHRVALSSEDGSTELRVPLVDGTAITGCSTISTDAFAAYGGYKAFAVPTNRLDGIYKGDVGLIKIDVEGHEQHVLDGAVETVRRCRPRMLVEVDERLSPGGLERAKSYFASLGYHGHYVYQGALLPVEDFSPDHLRRPTDLPDLTAPLQQRQRFGRYIYNFVFLPAEDQPEMVGKLRQRLTELPH